MTPAAPDPHPPASLPPAPPLPRPTYRPAGTALGVALIFWGLLASWVIALVGVVWFAAMLGGWIAEIVHERS